MCVGSTGQLSIHFAPHFPTPFGLFPTPQSSFYTVIILDFMQTTDNFWTGHCNLRELYLEAIFFPQKCKLKKCFCTVICCYTSGNKSKAFHVSFSCIFQSHDNTEVLRVYAILLLHVHVGQFSIPCSFIKYFKATHLNFIHVNQSFHFPSVLSARSNLTQDWPWICRSQNRGSTNRAIGACGNQWSHYLILPEVKSSKLCVLTKYRFCRSPYREDILVANDGEGKERVQEHSMSYITLA